MCSERSRESAEGFAEFTLVSPKGPAILPHCGVTANERGCKCELAAPPQKSFIELLCKSNKRPTMLSHSSFICQVGRNPALSSISVESRFRGAPGHGNSL